MLDAMNLPSDSEAMFQGSSAPGATVPGATVPGATVSGAELTGHQAARLNEQMVDLDMNDQVVQLVQTIAQAAEDKKGGEMTLLQVAEVSTLADFFLIVTGFSRVQVRAIARAIEDKVQEDYGRRPLHLEGMSDGSWVLIDYGDVIAHILMPQERDYYNLEAFWGHAARVDVTALVA
jgi:ribosome-associated protein